MLSVYIYIVVILILIATIIIIIIIIITTIIVLFSLNCSGISSTGPYLETIYLVAVLIHQV